MKDLYPKLRESIYHQMFPRICELIKLSGEEVLISAHISEFEHTPLFDLIKNDNQTDFLNIKIVQNYFTYVIGYNNYYKICFLSDAEKFLRIKDMNLISFGKIVFSELCKLEQKRKEVIDMINYTEKIPISLNREMILEKFNEKNKSNENKLFYENNIGQKISIELKEPGTVVHQEPAQLSGIYSSLSAFRNMPNHGIGGIGRSLASGHTQINSFAEASKLMSKYLNQL